MSFVLLTCLSFIYIKSQSNLFKVKSTILIKGNESDANSIESRIFEDFNVGSSTTNLDNQVEVFKSISTLEKVFNRLEFNKELFKKGFWKPEEVYSDSPFLIELDTQAHQLVNVPIDILSLNEKEYILSIDADNIKFKDPLKFESNDYKLINKFSFKDTVEFGAQVPHPYLNFSLNKNSDFFSKDALKNDYFIKIRDVEDLIFDRKERITIKPVNQDATILSISSVGEIVEKEKLFINTLLNTYLEIQLEDKNNTAQKTMDFIDFQVNQIADSLQGAESKLESFRIKENFMDLSYTARSAEEKLKELEQEGASLEVNKKYYKYLLDDLEENVDINTVVAPASIGIEEPLLNELIIKLQDLSGKKASLSYAVNSKNFELNRLNLEIQTVRDALLENVKSILNSTDIRLNEINSQISNTKSEIRKLPSNERNLVNIQRQFQLNDNLYNFLMQKKAEAGISKASNLPTDKILDVAHLVNKKPISPKPFFIYLLTAILSISIPLMLVVIQDYLNDKITSKDQVKELTDLPLIGVISKSKTNLTKNPNLQSFSRNLVAESFRSLRVNLKFVSSKANNVIGISSTVSGEGKTFCSSHLAIMMSLSGKKVALVGGDLRKPRLEEYFDIDKNIGGLSEYLIGSVSEEDIVQTTDFENLKVIDSGTEPPNPAELLESVKMHDLIKYLKKEFDIVLIDCPPLGIVSDYFIISKYIYTTLFVVRANYSKLKFLEDLNQVVSKNKLKNVSLILNDAERENSKYYGSYYTNSNGKPKKGMLKKELLKI